MIHESKHFLMIVDTLYESKTLFDDRGSIILIKNRSGYYDENTFL
jgi:hypothetical protein